MKRQKRRSFLRRSALLSSTAWMFPMTASSVGNLGRTKKEDLIRDAGMQLCLAYFWGIESRKVALARQMDVRGAVGGISPRMVQMSDRANYAFEVVKAVQEAWTREGLTLRVIEGPPSLYTKTKLGLPGRDEEIDNFITFLQNIAKLGIDTVCHNWMPVINWTRTDMAREGRGGALVSAFDIEDIRQEEAITTYGELNHERMWDNMEYFLRAVIPEAEQLGVKLALHPDDPPVDRIRGIPRIMTSVEAFKRVLDLYPSPSNGITFCQGSFASMGDQDQGVDIPAAIRYFGERGAIHFVHFRDVQGYRDRFAETFHDNGKTDMYEAMQAYYDIGFRGPLRPDHVPTMYGDSNEHPGYSTIGTLYAIGYIRGLMEGVVRR